MPPAPGTAPEARRRGADGWRRRLVRLGRWPAVALLTLVSIAGSVVVTGLLMQWFEIPGPFYGAALAIAVLVPLTIAPVVIYTVVSLLFDLEAAHAALQRLTSRDELTQAWTRRHFFAQLEVEFRRSHRTGPPLSVVMIDADHFKQVNDRHGHAAGDEALRGIAAECARMLRPYDTFARLGGEEFVLLLPGTDDRAAAEVAERIRAAIASLRFSSPKGGEFGITASLGISAVLPDDDHAPAVLERADAALYAAKHAGRDRCERR